MFCGITEPRIGMKLLLLFVMLNNDNVQFYQVLMPGETCAVVAKTINGGDAGNRRVHAVCRDQDIEK
jgi:hypothetical protein